MTSANSERLLFVNAAQVVTCAGDDGARHGAAMADAAVRTNVAVAVEGGRIAGVDLETKLRDRFAGATIIDCRGGVLTPGLVDSHTHAVFGASRAMEHELRASGVGYMEIARKGGGIHSSVADVGRRSEDELLDLALRRLPRIAASGTTTVEIKSGYGLSVAEELKLLRVIGAVQRTSSLRIIPTWLVHEIPPASRVTNIDRQRYVDMIVNDALPAVVELGIAKFADVFCEPGVFTIAETRRILEAAATAGLRTKLHADELENCGAAQLAASLGAASADHLAAISDEGIRALASSATVATLLPGTMLFLGRERQAPARALIDAGAAVALATDFNPGTSPTSNLPLVMTLGVSLLKMTAAETIIATTVNGAAALGVADETGCIAPGFAADLALFDVADFREIPYWYGEKLCLGSWRDGKTCLPLERGLS